MQKRILTIQDISCVGQCSLTVALPIISACGVETSILPSAILSTHTAGFTGFTVLSLTEEFPKIIAHWAKENVTFDGVYTGYVLKDQIDDVIGICEKFNKGLKIIDPVMADNGSFYYGFDEAFARDMARLCKGADVILPNLTEAAFLLGDEPVLEGYDKEYIELLSRRLAVELDVKTVVLTGVSFSADELGIACYDYKSDATDYYFGEKLPKNFHGTGDVYSSAFTGALMGGFTPFSSAKIAVDFTVEAMKLTMPYAKEHWYGVFFESALKNLANIVNGGNK
ncbi:MAG: pyridoxamine kinase [Clostridia bacterium]|nr:pyridoxamine kinase [Clostridia bacterium]